MSQIGGPYDEWDDVMEQLIVDSTLRAGALLLGRKTYEIFAAHWLRVGDERTRRPIGMLIRRRGDRELDRLAGYEYRRRSRTRRLQPDSSADSRVPTRAGSRGDR